MKIRPFLIPATLLSTLFSQGATTTLALSTFKSSLYSDILDAQGSHDTLVKLEAETMFSPTEASPNLSLVFNTSYTTELNATDYSIGLLSHQGNVETLSGYYFSLDHLTLGSELESTQVSFGYGRKIEDSFASLVIHYPFLNSDEKSAYGETYKAMPGMCITLHQDKTPYLSNTMSSELRILYFTQNDSHIDDKTIIQFSTFMQQDTWFKKTMGINIEYDFSSKLYWGVSVEIPLAKASTTSQHVALADGNFTTETITSLHETSRPHTLGIVYGVVDKSIAPIPPVDGSDNIDSGEADGSPISDPIDGSGPSDELDGSDGSDASD